MNIELLGQFSQRLLTLHGSQSHLRLECRRMVPAWSFAHRLSCSAAILAAVRQKRHLSNLSKNPEPALPRLVAQLRAIGIQISKRQILRLLNEGQDAFRTEARDVLQAGLASAAWISVDDSGARHRGRNGTCTQIGNDHFAAFATTVSKSRLNFLEVLRAGHADYVINA